MNELVAPRPIDIPDWLAGGILALVGITAILMTVLTSNSFTLDVNAASSSEWEVQDASGCSDTFGSFDAFIPGMRGHGSCNRGGFVPETTVHIVTNTNTSGTGSLKTAIAASCPKVVLFGVSGLINQQGNLETNSCDNFSIVGASSPGEIAITGSVDAMLLINGNEWTIDHLTIAAGDTDINSSPNIGNRDTIAIGTAAILQNTGILLNNTLIWGSDEGVQCFPPLNGDRTEILYWQNIMGLPVGQRLTHILQDTCGNHATIRSVYIHSFGRNPLVRSHGYFHANNFTANPGFQTSLLQPCGGTVGQGALTQMNFIDNFRVNGPDSSNHKTLESKSGTGCTTFEVHESGNAVMNNDNSIEDCSNNLCTTGFLVGELKPSLLTDVFPTGYVSETLTQTSEGLLAFATQITNHAGSHPKSRLAYIQTNIDESINMVDGVGGEGSLSATTSGEGGISQITPTSSSYDPTDSADNPCEIDMPTGAAADAIKTSGLTGLHEWVIGCFYDNVMPTGYREDGLEDFPAP